MCVTSVSLSIDRLYYKGRTETIRPVSMESKAFVEVCCCCYYFWRPVAIIDSWLCVFLQAMDDDSVSVERKRELLKEAIKYLLNASSILYSLSLPLSLSLSLSLDIRNSISLKL